MKINPVIISALLSSCAQFVPPTGGPKDETPPSLIQSYPENKTLSYKGNTIVLEFDELIDATSIRQELVITPTPKGIYSLKKKPYGIEIKFDESFKDSTTYTFNFRNGIKDLNEKNPAINLKLVFSTGTEIDSLGLNGKVTDLWTHLPAKEVLVGLYALNSSDTIPLINRKPDYFTQTDTSGNYLFENLRSSNYRILSFTDKNLNLTYDSKTEMFGFLPDTIKLDSIIKNIDLSIYPNNNNPPKVKRSLSRQLNYSVTFDKPIKDINVTFPNKDSLTYQIRDAELLFFNHPFTSDTTLTKIIVSDSSENILEKDLKVVFNTNIKTEPKPELLSISSKIIKANATVKKPEEYILNFEYPIIELDTTKISITSDTTSLEKFTTLWLDKSQTELAIRFQASAKRELKLLILSGALTNYKLDTNSTYQLINKLYQQDSYGSMKGSYPNFIGQKIIEIIHPTSFQKIESQIFRDTYHFPEVLPGTYKIRIIEDSNNNGQWDTGSFEENKLPERIVISKGIIKLKANFELNDIQID